ncbi:MAG: hypothetical protein LBM74_07270 [Oscillospiraceae bacterium]|jgi:hypothetical protein|nr:hypothetical protein [Oscillospiraceae bacterium]
MDLGLANVASHEFIRRFGEIRQRDNPHEVQESIYAAANRSFSLRPNNSFLFDGNKRFVPRLVFKRLFSDGKNCRVDVGIKNAFLTKYNGAAIDEIVKSVYGMMIDTPSILIDNNDKHRATDMKELGRELAHLYLTSTTAMPKRNGNNIDRKWAVACNVMALIEIEESELKSLDFHSYIPIKLNGLSDSHIALYYKYEKDIIRGYNMPLWLIVTNNKTRKDKVRNLRIYLLKLHQERECFRQVLNRFGPEVFDDEDFGGNKILRDYVQKCIYGSLLKKARYGYRNDEMNGIVNDIDEIVNRNQINTLLGRFKTETIGDIEKRSAE